LPVGEPFLFLRGRLMKKYALLPPKGGLRGADKKIENGNKN